MYPWSFVTTFSWWKISSVHPFFPERIDIFSLPFTVMVTPSCTNGCLTWTANFTCCPATTSCCCNDNWIGFIEFIAKISARTLLSSKVGQLSVTNISVRTWNASAMTPASCHQKNFRTEQKWWGWACAGDVWIDYIDQSCSAVRWPPPFVTSWARLSGSARQFKISSNSAEPATWTNGVPVCPLPSTCSHLRAVRR